ncbi:MAG: ribonuclease HII [Acidobacteriota bacterium]
MACTFDNEARLRALGFLAAAGVDEAGRGCLFGPVTAAAVVLPLDCSIAGLRDSKIIPAPERLRLAARIKAEAISWAFGFASVAEIARINILEASRLAMLRAVSTLDPPADALLIDAIRIPSPLPQFPLIKGDALSRSIAAASILAKVERDRLLDAFARRYPFYHLDSNKGYGTAAHLAALRQHGPTPQHRATFAPVREIIRARESRP